MLTRWIFVLSILYYYIFVKIILYFLIVSTEINVELNLIEIMDETNAKSEFKKEISKAKTISINCKEIKSLNNLSKK